MLKEKYAIRKLRKLKRIIQANKFPVYFHDDYELGRNKGYDEVIEWINKQIHDIRQSYKLK